MNGFALEKLFISMSSDTNWSMMMDFQTSKCCYSLEIHSWIWFKFRKLQRKQHLLVNNYYICIAYSCSDFYVLLTPKSLFLISQDMKVRLLAIFHSSLKTRD